MNLTLITSKGRGASRTIAAPKGKASPLRIVLSPEQEYQDLRWHREDFTGFRLEVWQVAATRGTTRPRFYHLRFNLSLSKPRPCRSSREFDTVERALGHARRAATRWRLLIDQRQAVKRPKRRGRFKEVPLRSEPDRIEALGTIAEICRHGDPLCPVCSQQVNVPRIAGILGATGTAY